MAIDPNWVRENPKEAARQIDLLIIERDQYRAAEEAQIALRVKAVEREQVLAAHMDAVVLKGDWLAQSANICECDDMGIQLEHWAAVKKTQPTTSLARRDALKHAEGAVDFVAWLEKECERNGEVGEIFGMTLSGITGESRAAPNLRAARMIFAEAKKIAEWKLGQAVAVKS